MRGLGYLAWIPGAPRSELRRLEDAAPLLLGSLGSGGRFERTNQAGDGRSGVGVAGKARLRPPDRVENRGVVASAKGGTDRRSSNCRRCGAGRHSTGGRFWR